MIKIYAHMSNEVFYTLMVIENDSVLYSNALHEDLLDEKIDELILRYSQRNKPIVIYKHNKIDDILMEGEKQ